MADPMSADPLTAAAQQAFAASVGAVEEFDEIADAVRAELPDASDDDSRRRPARSRPAWPSPPRLVLGDVGTRVVTVSAGGFDTHADQLGTHATLLADLANGLDAFWATLDAAGASDRVLLATTSEFGRRVGENASDGCDHGAAGVSFVMADSLAGAQFGSLDTGDLLDGDLRPQIDPRSLFTACLDWLGGDVEQILGRRHDEIQLLG